MQKILVTIAAMAVSIAAMATDYTDKMAIQVASGDVVIQEATVSATEQEDGNYTFELRNFILEQAGSSMAIGNITMTDVPTTVDENGTICMESVQDINITNGDDPSVSFWMGPLMGTITVTLQAWICGGELYALIDIPVSGMDVKVTFGTNYKPYTGSMSITVGDTDPVTDESTVYAGEQVDGAYSFMLNNFIFTLEGASMGIGNIKLTDVPATVNDDGSISLSSTQGIRISNGDDPSIGFWMGPLLGTIDVSIDAKISGSDLTATIVIPYSGRDIIVNFGGGDTGIEAVGATSVDKSAKAMYDVSGRMVSGPTKGINIIRRADGTTVKVLNR